MNSLSHNNIRGMQLAALGFSLYAIGDLFIKMAAANYAPEQIGFYINIFFLPLILAFSSRVGGLRNTLRTKHLKLHLLRACCGMFIFFMMTNGFKTLGMATSYTLIFLGPFVATILSIFFLGAKVGPYRWTAIVAGFTGVLVVLRPGFVPLEPAAIGILVAALTYGVSNIIIRKIGDREPLLAFSLFTALSSFVVMGSIMLWKGEMRLPEPEHIPYFVTTAVFHVFGNFTTSRAFASAETSVIAPFHYTQLLWGILFGYLVFGQGIDIWTALGGAIIVGSGIYMIHREHVRHREITHGVVASGAALE